MQKLVLALSALSLVVGAAPSIAAPCHDAKGKFIKCPAKKAAAPARCRNAKGHFAKCGTPGAKPA